MPASVDHYDDIRPWTDEELPAVLERILNDTDLLASVAGMALPALRSSRMSWFRNALAPVVALFLKFKLRRVRTIDDFQNFLSHYLEQLIRETIAALTWSGVEALPAGPHLFISNHRDIVMDPALTNYAMWKSSRTTVRIAVGDNLLRRPQVADLIRLNKGFVVKRSLSSPQEAIAWRRRFARFIRKSLLEDSESVWIAQRNGRAKDGDDKTMPNLIRMLLMGKDQNLAGAELLNALSIVPLSISYEYDPCDTSKAQELYTLNRKGTYTKDEAEDLGSIIEGCIGFKGRVHLAFGEPLKVQDTDIKVIAAEIDRQIHRNYMLQPSNYLACERLQEPYQAGRCSAFGQQFKKSEFAADSTRFNNRIDSQAAELVPFLLNMYANPLRNQQAVSD